MTIVHIKRFCPSLNIEVEFFERFLKSKLHSAHLDIISPFCDFSLEDEVLLILRTVVQHKDPRPFLIGYDLRVSLQEDFLAIALVETETVAAQPTASFLFLACVGATVVICLKIV